jgi:hypothetical protein
MVLFGVSQYDPLTFVIGPSVLGLVALAASLVPARRATRRLERHLAMNEGGSQRRSVRASFVPALAGRVGRNL